MVTLRRWARCLCSHRYTPCQVPRSQRPLATGTDSDVWGNTLLPVETARTSLHTTSAAIGPGLPLGIGSALGGGKSVVIQGDGGFMLHIGELATAAQFNVPVVVLVFNDGGYGECNENCRLGEYCGDGILQEAYEFCDDGNFIDNDNCPSSCRTVEIE